MKKQKNNSNKWKTFGNNVGFWIVIIIACILLMQMVSTEGSPQKIKVSLNTTIRQVFTE